MTNIKKTALTLSAIVLFASSSFAATTNKLTVVDSFSTSEPVSVEFLGEDANYVFFQVIVKPGAAKTASLEVNDTNEGDLYTGKFNTAKTQTLKIEKKDNQELGFTVAVGNERYSKTFTLMPTVVLNNAE